MSRCVETTPYTDPSRETPRLRTWLRSCLFFPSTRRLRRFWPTNPSSSALGSVRDPACSLPTPRHGCAPFCLVFAAFDHPGVRLVLRELRDRPQVKASRRRRRSVLLLCGRFRDASNIGLPLDECSSRPPRLVSGVVPRTRARTTGRGFVSLRRVEPPCVL